MNGVTPPPPAADSSGDGGGDAVHELKAKAVSLFDDIDEDDLSRDAMMYVVAVQMMRHHPVIVRTVQLLRGEPLADIYTPEELERLDERWVTFLLVVALLAGLYVANG